MDDKGKHLTIIVIAGLLIGAIAGVAGLLNQGGQETGSTTPPTEGSATLMVSADSGLTNSTEIRGVYVVESADASAALNDNLEADPSGLVVNSFTTSGGSASVDWGTEYQLIIYAYGEENEVSNDPANIRVGIDGDYWGDSSGSVDTPAGTDNCSDEYMLTAGDDGFVPSYQSFQINGDNHIALNYLGNSGGFTLSRDETASIDEILLQAYF